MELCSIDRKNRGHTFKTLMNKFRAQGLVEQFIKYEKEGERGRYSKPSMIRFKNAQGFLLALSLTEAPGAVKYRVLQARITAITATIPHIRRIQALTRNVANQREQLQTKDGQIQAQGEQIQTKDEQLREQRSRAEAELAQINADIQQAQEELVRTQAEAVRVRRRLVVEQRGVWHSVALDFGINPIYKPRPNGDWGTWMRIRDYLKRQGKITKGTGERARWIFRNPECLEWYINMLPNLQARFN